MKSSPIGLLVAVALGIFPAQSWAQAKAGKVTVAGKAAATKDSEGVIDADASGSAAAGSDAAEAAPAAGDTPRAMPPRKPENRRLAPVSTTSVRSIPQHVPIWTWTRRLLAR